MDPYAERMILKQQREARRRERAEIKQQQKQRKALMGIGRPSEWVKDYQTTVRLNRLAFNVLQAAGLSVQDVMNIALDAYLWHRDINGLEYKDGQHPLLSPEADALHLLRPPVRPLPDISELVTRDFAYGMNMERKERKDGIKENRVKLLSSYHKAKRDKSDEMIREGIQALQDAGITETEAEYDARMLREQADLQRRLEELDG